MAKENCPLCNGTGKIPKEEYEINEYGQKRIILSKKVVKVGDFYLIARVLKTSKFRNANQYTKPMPRAKFYRYVCKRCEEVLK